MPDSAASADSAGEPMSTRFLYAVGLRRRHAQHELPQRSIAVNCHSVNVSAAFPSNSIATVKYPRGTFMFKFLFEQFTRLANVFFLMTSLIQQVDGVTPTSRWSTLLPLSVVLTVTGFKELLEDRRREQSDRTVNKRPVRVLRGSSFELVRWDELRVGDVVRLASGEHIPADLLLLSSSEPDAICYIETANLDGETNLKIKQGRPETAFLLSPELVCNLDGTIRCEHPNNSLYTFEGALESPYIAARAANQATIPLDPTQILLRGAQLRNTAWIYAVVLYTGHDAKLLRNATATPIKRTSVELLTNVQVAFLFVLLLILAVVCLIGSSIENYDLHWYLSTAVVSRSKSLQMFLDFLTYLVLFNNLIPISLIVTMEFVKYFHSILINSDIDMYHPETDTPALCRTSSLVEELGRVEYIFSDKTGTLTCNIMEFRSCCIAGVRYAGPLPSSSLAANSILGHASALASSGISPEALESLLAQEISLAANNSDNVDRTYTSLLRELYLDKSRSTLIHHFLLLLSACHTVIPELPQGPTLYDQDKNILTSDFANSKTNLDNFNPNLDKKTNAKDLSSSSSAAHNSSPKIHSQHSSLARSLTHWRKSLTRSAIFGNSQQSSSPAAEEEQPMVELNSAASASDPQFLDTGAVRAANETFTALPVQPQPQQQLLQPSLSDENVLDKIVYQASSPDEGALVSGARFLGYAFHTRRPTSINVRCAGQDGELRVLNICEFNSTRKRMSTILRLPDGQIILYCKGADTVILERLDTTPGSNPHVQTTLAALESYAAEGLRTLCLAYRIIPSDEYDAWSVKYDAAACSLVNRSQMLDDVAEEIEKNLILLGATAIEDKLQDGVPETIATLALAGIKIWVLTGDRQETAINIGYSCKLLTEDMSLITINFDTKEETKFEIERQLSIVKSINNPPGGGDPANLNAKNNDTRGAGNRNRAGGSTASWSGIKDFFCSTNDSTNIGSSRSDEVESLALIIDGKTLKYALESDLRYSFFELASMCKAVICCRVSPMQKALVVKLVKQYKKSILLAIGDGANDVSMIQAAHVGIGISGQEGLQAARSADFAISQFRFLRKLLLVHGAWSYHRLSKIVLYSFYKNITLYITQFWYGFSNGFSGQTIHESWLLLLFNVCFTALPPLVIGIFDQFASARMLDRYPQIYKLGQSGEFFNVKVFWAWVLNGFFHSIILYFIVMAIFGTSSGFAGGIDAGLWFISVTLYTCVLFTVLLKAALVASLWTKWVVLATVGSILFFIFFLPLYILILPRIGIAGELYGMESALGTVLFWATVLLVPFLAILRDVVWKYVKRMYFTRPYHIVQEIQKFNIPDYRPRMERFRIAVHRVRQIQRIKKSRGYAFSQGDSGQADLIRVYDTTRIKPKG